MVREGKRSSKGLQVLERRELVYPLRQRGLKYRQIAEMVREWAPTAGVELPNGYDRRHAQLDMARYRAQRKKERDRLAQLQRETALDRCQNLLQKVWRRATRILEPVGMRDTARRKS